MEREGCGRGTSRGERVTHLPQIAGRGPTVPSRRVTIAVFLIVTAGQLILGFPPTRAGQTSPRVDIDRDRECRREDGTLSRYLLCRELTALRPGDPQRYYALLAKADEMVLRNLPRTAKRRTGTPVLRQMHTVGHGATDPQGTDLLVDLFDGWEARCDSDVGDDCSFDHADCDLLSILNYGSSERYYGEQFASSGFSMVRTAPTHVITGFASGSRVTSALETTNGTIVSNFHGIFTRTAVLRAGKRGYLRPMKESEIVAMHLASIGLRLMDQRRYDLALSLFDEALAFNDREFLAHSGRTQALITKAIEPFVPVVQSSRDCVRNAEGFAETHDLLLDEAERSIRWVLAWSDEYHYAHYLLGTINYLQNDLLEAHHAFRAATSRQARPSYFYGLGLTRLRLGMNKKAIRSLRKSRELVANLEQTEGRDAGLKSAGLALALAYKVMAEEERSYKAARSGVRSVERALHTGPRTVCEQVLQDQLLVLQKRLVPPDWGFPVPAFLSGPIHSADLKPE